MDLINLNVCPYKNFFFTLWVIDFFLIERNIKSVHCRSAMAIIKNTTAATVRGVFDYKTELLHKK